MSIQASWSNIISGVGQAAGTLKGINFMKNQQLQQQPTQDLEQMSAEELADYSRNKQDPRLNNIINEMQVRLSEKYGISQEDAQRLADDIRLGNGEGWTSRFDEARMAAQRAKDAAAEADSKPANNVSTAEEAVAHLLEIQRQAQGGNV